MTMATQSSDRLSHGYFKSIPYLGASSVCDFVEQQAAAHPLLNEVVDFERAGAAREVYRLVSTATEFDSDSTGRGDSYRTAQRDPSVRAVGIDHLLTVADVIHGGAVLDVLGGDGTLARHVAATKPKCTRPTILTADISAQMVNAALSQNLPAIRQSASFYFLRPKCFDAVVIAYGTHHIPSVERRRAVAEAFRVVKHGGRVVIHDFHTKSPMAKFFSMLVDPFAPGGHRHQHFDAVSLSAPFADVADHLQVSHMYDPLVVYAHTGRRARDKLINYVVDMYGIRAWATRQSRDHVWDQLVEIFDHTEYLAYTKVSDVNPAHPVKPRIDNEGSKRFRACIPRYALVAVGHKRAAAYSAA